MNRKQEIACVLDQLNFFSACKIIALRKEFNFKEVQYCTITKFMELVVHFSIIKKMLANLIKPLDYEVGRILSKNGECIYWQWNSDVTQLGFDIMKKSKTANHLADRLSNNYNQNKIRLFLADKIANEIATAIRLVQVVAHQSWGKGQDDKSVPLLMVSGTPWFSYVEKYAAQKAVKVRSYVSFAGFTGTLLCLSKFLVEFIINSTCLLFPFERCRQEKENLTVAVPYLNGIEFERRNDIFWFPNSKIDPKNIVVYFRSSGHPLSAGIKSRLEELGFQHANLLLASPNNSFLGCLNGKVNVFPTRYYVYRLSRALGEFSKLIFQNLFNFKEINWRCLAWLGFLLNKIALYESFFIRRNTKIHFSLFGLGDDLMASNLAMERIGGIDVSTHWSNMPVVHIDHVNPHDVFFCWGPYHKKLFDSFPFLTKFFIYSGYIYDSIFPALRGKAAELRQQLLNRGGNFVVAFLDEQHDKNCSNPRSAIEDSYLTLLSLVLNDPAFCLLIKTKRDSAFRELNSAKVNQLLDKAIGTGRCVWFHKDKFPSEIVQAADLAVGIGIYNTAILEAWLCGIPFLTFDFGQPTYCQLHKYFHGKTSFTDINELVGMIKKFRASRQILAPDHHDVLKLIDPFQDKKASERIGSYMKTLLDRFSQGASAVKALEEANHAYKLSYGTDTVIAHRGKL